MMGIVTVYRAFFSGRPAVAYRGAGGCSGAATAAHRVGEDPSGTRAHGGASRRRRALGHGNPRNWWRAP